MPLQQISQASPAKPLFCLEKIKIKIL